MIRAILPNGENEYFDNENRPLVALYDVDRFNIFVGENNSGKSRLVRMLFRSNTIFITEKLNGNMVQHLNNVIQNVRDLIRTTKNEKIGFNLNEIEKAYAEKDFYSLFKNIHIPMNKWRFLESENQDDDTRRKLSAVDASMDNLCMCFEQRIGQTAGRNRTLGIYKGNCFYIPVLRGIENFDSYFDKDSLKALDEARLTRSQWLALQEYAENSKRIYTEKICKTYSIDERFVFTAENLYDEIKKKLLGSEEDRIQIKEFQDFISEQFYGKKGLVTLIPRVGTGRNHLRVKIGDADERALYDLGDGIKQMITILYKVFEKRGEEAFFCIEEPENSLHPGYQHKLMRILQSKEFEKHQFFIVTHSNHIIESAINIGNTTIYKVINMSKKNNSFKVVKSSGKDMEILDLLGVTNGSVFMANCLIFVEGISDRILIGKYLEVYMKGIGREYEENIHFAFVETGGGNISHWSFLDGMGIENVDTINVPSFSNRSFVICDSDNKSKKERKEKIKRMVGEKCFYELPVREIENTIKRSVLEKTILTGEEDRITNEYDENKKGYYNQEHIGSFIKEHYKTNRNYEGPRGTILNKMDFARRIAKNIKSTDDLTNVAKDLCGRLVDFIDEVNEKLI